MRIYGKSVFSHKFFSMARILTGIQSTNQPHLGNILGAIQPLIKRSHAGGHEAFAFIADLHSLTTVRDAAFRRESTLKVAATWLACGFDPEAHVLYRQSDLPEVTELTWYLSCFAPYPMLSNAHSFKDKAARVNEVSAGLFTYPVLMAADILGYDAEIVPVGKDQLQHLEITRDLAKSFNHLYGQTFVIPEASVDQNVMIVPGTDGQKMSKSYQNFIDIFLEEKALKKVIMGIQTDSTPMESPKNPDTCRVFNLFKVVASAAEVENLRQRYLAGGLGYGHAKSVLLEAILIRFQKERKEYSAFIQDIPALEQILQIGANKARPVIHAVLSRVREKLGF